MKKTTKALLFLKKNAVYCVLALCILAIGLSITVAVIRGNTADEMTNAGIEQPLPDDENEQTGTTPEPDDEPVVETVTFLMPITNCTAILDYSEQMVFNQTLNRYSAHMAIDFFAPEGTQVYAVSGGVIESVTNDVLKGVSITIDHGNGLKTVYNSLADGEYVYIGKTVNKGDVIGEVSVSNKQEYKSGAHLHFEVIENGEKIDPSKYLVISEK